MIPRSRLFYTIAASLGVVLLIYVAASVVAARSDEAVQAASHQRDYWKGQYEAKAGELEKLRAAYDADRAAADISAQVADTTRKVARASKVPRKAGPPPEADPVLVQELVQMGWRPGLTISADPFKVSDVGHADAQLAWTWGKEAARVPALEERITKDDAALAADEKAIGDCKQAVASADAVIQGKDELLAVEAKRREAADAMVAGMVKQQKAERKKWYIKVGAAAAVAYLAGKKL